MATHHEQILMPWGENEKVDRAAVDALTADVPEAKTMTPGQAAVILDCCRSTVDNMIQEGVLLARVIGKNPTEAKKKNWRVIVKIDRPFDPERKTLLSLEEAKMLFSNVAG
jgi:hypothetical protein